MKTKKMPILVLVLALAAIDGSLSVFAQPAQSADEEPVQALQSLKWRSIGPANMGGRVTAITGVAGDRQTFYVGGAHGGVFKTTNGGVTFETLFTGQRAYSVGALAVAPSDPNVIWLGSGEGDPRNSASYGNGAYRSIDGGKSWTHLGLDDSERVKRIVVDPRDPDTAFVCALGHAWGANEERGVFKTTDGGRSWSKVLFIDEDTGCSDLAMEAANPRVLYAGMWTFRRRPWRFDDGGKETALYRSMDAGHTWEKLTEGLPDGPMARIGVDVAQSRPNIVYLVTEFKEGGILFRSEDRGQSWEKVHDEPRINFRPFYYSDIRVDPNNPDHIYSLSGGLYKSTDGGKTFSRIGRDVHGDHQAFWIDPEDSNHLLSGSDGGFQVSFDGGANWDIINNVVLSQYYQLQVDDRDPYFVCGGFQDNGTWCGPSRVTESDGILKKHWYRIAGGDGYYALPVPGQPHLVYANLQGGVIMFTDLEVGSTRQIHPYPKITGSAGDAIVDHKYRFNWNSPIHISPHDPDTVYFGGNVIFKTTDQGHSWEVISPDLTTDDESKQQTSGGDVYQDNTAAEFHTTILTIAESPVTAGVSWAGTDDGNIQITRDGGRNWTNVKDNVTGLPPFSWIAKIAPSPHTAGAAYLAVDNHRSDQFEPLAFKTADFGQTWTPIHQGLPIDDYVHVVREDPRVRDLLYAGMEHGIFASWDGGKSWSSIRLNLPPLAVREIRVHPRDNDLIIGTHGRGAWILDDVTPLQQLPSTTGKDLHLFPIRRATRWHIGNRGASLGQRAFQGENPEYGAVINFFVRSVPEEKKDSQEAEGEKEPDSDSGAKIEIRDSQGTTIRTLSVEELTAGVNRLHWDLRHDGAGRGSGPRAVPGPYTAVLSYGETELSAEFEMRPDPRAKLPLSHYKEQSEVTLALLDLQKKVETIMEESGQAVEQLKGLRKNLKAAYEDREDGQQPEFDYKGIRAEINQAVKELESFRDSDLLRPPPGMGYRQRPRLREELRSLMRSVDGATARPTEPQKLRLAELRLETKQVEEKYRHILENQIAEINEAVSKLPHILLP